jgi:hypothetical protein
LTTRLASRRSEAANLEGFFSGVGFGAFFLSGKQYSR